MAHLLISWGAKLICAIPIVIAVWARWRRSPVYHSAWLAACTSCSVLISSTIGWESACHQLSWKWGQITGSFFSLIITFIILQIIYETWRRLHILPLWHTWECFGQVWRRLACVCLNFSDFLSLTFQYSASLDLRVELLGLHLRSTQSREHCTVFDCLRWVLVRGVV